MTSHLGVLARSFTWLGVIFGMLAVSAQILPAADTWWHVAAGERLLEAGRLLHTDPFSFTAGDHPWLNHEWLVEIIFAQVFQTWGLTGLCVLKFLLLLFAGAILPSLSHYRNKGRSDWLWLLPVVALVCEWAFFVDVRAYLVTYLLLSFTVFCLLEFERTNNWKWLSPLPLAQLIWVNSHGGFILGPAVMGVFFLMGRERKTLGFFTALTVAAATINPEGPKMLLFPFSLLKKDAFSVGLNEWARPDLMGAQLPYSILVAAVVALVVWKRKTLNWSLFFSTSAFLILGLIAWRHEPLAAIMLFYFLPDTLPSLESRPRALLAVATAFLIGSLFYLNEKRDLTPDKMLGLFFFPTGAVQFMSANPELPRHFFHPYGWGGFLLWTLPENYKVFFDGRAHTVYPESVFRDGYYLQYGETWSKLLAKRGITPPTQTRAELLDSYGIDLVLTNRFQGDLTEILAQDHRWQPIFTDATSVLYLRKESR